MNTQAILNPAIAPISPIQTPKQADGPSSDTSFNQVLSREIADRGNANESNTADARETGSAGASSPAPAKASGKTTEKDKAKESADTPPPDSVTTTAPTPAEMLALVANLGQFTATKPDAAAAVVNRPASATTKPDDAVSAVTGPALNVPTVPVSALATDLLPASLTPAPLTPAPAMPTPLATARLPAPIATSPAPVVTPAAAQAKVTTPVAEDAKPAGGAAKIDLSARTETKELTVDGQSAAARTKSPSSELKADGNFAAAMKEAGDAKQPVDQGSAVKTQPVKSEMAAAAVIDAVPAAIKSLEVQAATAPALAPFQQAALNNAQGINGHGTEKLTPPVGSAAWDQALGQKVVWMVAGAQQSASLTLNPPDLGPLQVVLTVSNSQANATFIATQPEVRQAIEAAMPKLREMLGDAGIQLGQATVSTGTPNQNGAPGEQSQKTSRPLDPFGDTADTMVQVNRGRTISSGQGLVDTFA